MKQNKIQVSILGKGTETVTLAESDTVENVRNMLALDKDVKAINKQGTEMSDTETVDTDISFVPNVQGGK